MKAISIKQPWASMIASGQKTIETRTWATDYRGELLIVASKRPKIRQSMGSGWLPVGQAIAVANLISCRLMSKKDERNACCEVYPGAVSWYLSNIREIEPFAVKGRLGLYEVPDVNFCRQCGWRIAETVIYCGECCCEEDIAY